MMHVKALLQSVAILLKGGTIALTVRIGLAEAFIRMPAYVVTIILAGIVAFMVYGVYSHLTLSDQEEEKTKIKPWLINEGDTIYRATVKTDLHFFVDEWTYDAYYINVDELDFPTREECQLFCDTMNIAIAPTLRE